MANLNLMNMSKPKPMAPGPATTPAATTKPTVKKKKAPSTGGGLAAALSQKSLV